MIAVAIGIAAATAGSAWAAGGCGGVSQTGQSVALETQTASGGTVFPQTQKPEEPAN